ncbi:MAG: hypothetical protein KGO48_18885 [Alphaproteobacteria bacterium]|nr:hypothetical protein [Alphaproteobacteria bacterium]
MAVLAGAARPANSTSYGQMRRELVVLDGVSAFAVDGLTIPGVKSLELIRSDRTRVVSCLTFGLPCRINAVSTWAVSILAPA